jgi:cation/acetate symporter
VPVSVDVFFAFVAATLGITYWAAKRSREASAYFAAGRRITAWQNGFAVAGDFMSAASFLGIVGLIALQGFDGFLYAVGGFVAFVTILLLVAEPLRNTGKYTMGDVLAYRLRPRPVRALAALSTLVTILFYMIAQMVGAGALVTLLLTNSGISYNMAVTGVGILMMVYVVFGGMLATTWVQIIKAMMLSACALALSVFVFAHFHFRPGEFFAAASQVAYHQKNQLVVRDFLQPGLRYKPPYGPLDLISLSLVFICGTAGLPHILVKFYTVPDARTARKSVVWAMILIGSFYVMTSVLGLGAAIIVGPDYILTHGGTNMSGPLLAQAVAGDVFLALVSAVAFATILAVVAGLTISASTSFAHDFWMNVIHRGAERKSGETVLVARIAALAVGAIAIMIAIVLGPASNAGILATLGMAVAASANFPVIALSIFWRRFNTAGAIAGLSVGLLASIGLILASPNFMGIDPSNATGAVHHLIQAKAWFPLENAGIVSVPLGFLAAIAGTLLTHEPGSEAKFNEFAVRANTGLGAETAADNTIAL